MAVFDLMDNQLGPHGPGYHAIIIEGPDDNPTGFSLLTISDDNGIYEYQGGEPTQGYIELLDTAILRRNDHFLIKNMWVILHLMNQLIMSICIPQAIQMLVGILMTRMLEAT